MTYRYRGFCLLLTLFALGPLCAQVTFPYNGVYDQREGHYAFTGATVHVSPTETIENATLTIRDGKVVDVREGGPVNAGAVEVGVSGKHIYPSFIEVYGSYGIPEGESGGSRSWNSPPPVGK